MRSSSQATTYQDVLELHQAYLDVLARHYQFIRNMDAGKMSDIEINQYFKEIFDIDISGDAVARKHNLKTMMSLVKSSVNEAYRENLQINIIAKKENKEAAMSAFSLYLELRNKDIKFMERMTKKSGSKSFMAIIEEIGKPAMIQSLFDMMKAVVPTQHRDLVRIITYRDIKNLDQIVNRESYECHWNKLLDEINRVAKKIGIDGSPKINAASKIDGYDALLLKTCADRGVTILTNAERIEFGKRVSGTIEKLKQQIIVHENYMATTHDKSSEVEQLYKNAEFYYSIHDAMIEIRKTDVDHAMLDTITEELVREVVKAQKLFDSTKSKVKPEHDKLAKMIEALKASLLEAIDFTDSPNKKSILNILLLDMDFIYDKLTDYESHMKIFKGNYHADYDVNEISKAANILHGIQKSIIKRHEELVMKLRDVTQMKDDVHILSDMQKAETAAADERRKAAVADDEKRIAQLEQDKQRTLEYKESLAKERLQKLENKQARAEAKVNPVEEAPVIKVSDELAAKILTINNNNFKVLRIIMSQKGETHIDSVVNLINELGGSVTETGGGSSHKCIRIGRHCALVTNHTKSVDKKESKKKKAADKKEPDDAKGTVATGGMFRSHGDESGVMGKFNLGLVANTFNKAGVTLELLDEYEEKRRLRKIAPGYTSGHTSE